MRFPDRASPSGKQKPAPDLRLCATTHLARPPVLHLGKRYSSWGLTTYAQLTRPLADTAEAMQHVLSVALKSWHATPQTMNQPPTPAPARKRRMPAATKPRPALHCGGLSLGPYTSHRGGRRVAVAEKLKNWAVAAGRARNSAFYGAPPTRLTYLP
ncbi:hypothetical protein Ari01nite_21060 [Paractinoplanes rishiriensis]|uniref:Uncharacterized protein n=1 Tax=Paractinoplanes rishiriensis TaxID=1050105 RepID=A0A919MP23_9ACTN|nr:hypothetical protein Ari01nite_21060 [Actinoplanes rishiriensis]